MNSMTDPIFQFIDSFIQSFLGFIVDFARQILAAFLF